MTLCDVTQETELSLTNCLHYRVLLLSVLPDYFSSQRTISLTSSTKKLQLPSTLRRFFHFFKSFTAVQQNRPNMIV